MREALLARQSGKGAVLDTSRLGARIVAASQVQFADVRLNNALAEIQQAKSRRDPTVWLMAAFVLLICLFANLGAMGLVGPDEPRYAWIARAMAETGDWITPRLYGQPWFEKPILYYWAAAAGFRLHLPAEWAAGCRRHWPLSQPPWQLAGWPGSTRTVMPLLSRAPIYWQCSFSPRASPL